MKNIFNSTLMIVFTLFLTISPTWANNNNLLGELIGRSLGAFGGAKLCGGNTATQVACGSVGSVLGSRIVAPAFNPRHQYQNNPQFRYQNNVQPQNQNNVQPQNQNNYPSQYQNNYRAIPPIYTQSCKTVAVEAGGGIFVERVACRMSNGSWKFVR